MTNQLKLSICALFVLIFATTLHAEIIRDSHVRVSYQDKQQLQVLLRMGLDIIDEGDGYIEIVSYPDEIEQLQQDGYETKILKESFSKFYRERLEAEIGPKDMGGYKTLAEVYAYLDGIVLDHPSIVSTKVNVGSTTEGRMMWAVKISDNPNVDEDEPEVLFNSAIHAREVITPEVLLNAMDYLTDNYGVVQEITDLVDSREIWFVVVVNPDGYFHNQIIAPGGGGMWRKNRRHNGGTSYGVDLNRNYGYEWGYDDLGSSANPTSETYRGTGPFSEPESQNMKAFTEAHEFVIVVYFHSYSNLILWPWGYDELYTPDEEIFKQLGDSMSAWNGYDPGPGWHLYVANGTTDDWGYGEQTTKNKNFSFTFEVGSNVDGFWPLVERIPQLVSENLEPILFMARVADDVYSLTPPASPIAASPELVIGDSYSLTWTHDDTLNPAVGYEITELVGPSLTIDGADDLGGWSNSGFSVATDFGYSDSSSFYSGSGNSIVHYFQSTEPLAVEAGDTLRFKTFYDIEAFWDFAYVEVSTDGVIFNPIPGNRTITNNPNGTNRGHGITGTITDWADGLFDLSAFAGQDIWIRFSYHTDGGVVGEGFYVDDIFPHLEFESKTVVDPMFAGNQYDFGGKSTGAYYYQVRAIDADDQWSGYSPLTRTAVITPGTAGDLDLDGIPATVADLTFFDLYFHSGLSVFNINMDAQVGQTDIDCDAIVLTVADRNRLVDLIVGRDQPCFATTQTPQPLTTQNGSSDRSGKGVTEADKRISFISEGTISLVATQITDSDSASLSVVLSDATAGIVGFQVCIEYDTTGVGLLQVATGDQTSNWPLFDHYRTVSGSLATLRIAGTAFQVGSTPILTDIQPQSASVSLAEISLLYHAAAGITTDFRFSWETCTDNSLALGFLDGAAVALDEVVVSRTVYDATLADITGSQPQYGGADNSCDYGLLGPGPSSAIDFVSGQLTFTPSSCCSESVGDANGIGGETPTVSDISIIVDLLFISGTELGCYAEADANQSGFPDPDRTDITVSDISIIVDFLFITGTPLPDCP